MICYAAINFMMLFALVVSVLFTFFIKTVVRMATFIVFRKEARRGRGIVPLEFTFPLAQFPDGNRSS